MMRLYGLSPESITDTDDRGELVTYSPNVLLTETDDPRRIAFVRDMAQKDGFTDFEIVEYDPSDMTAPDFIRAIH